MVGQHKRLAETGRLPPAQRRIVRVLAVIGAVALLIGGVLAFTDTGGGTAKGCVALTVPSTTGGAVIQACGGRAARLCADPTAGVSASLTAVLRRRCLRAGYRVSA